MSARRGRKPAPASDLIARMPYERWCTPAELRDGRAFQDQDRDLAFVRARAAARYTGQRLYT